LNYKRTRLIIILLPVFWQEYNCFAGMIAFIGLAVPHIAKLVFQTSNHYTILEYFYFWASIMLICDSISQVPGGDITAN
jgi:iron complex transport system permease protein